MFTDSHEWEKKHFDIITDYIEISDHAWIGAFSHIASGCRIGEGSVLIMASRDPRELSPSTIYSEIRGQAV